MSHHTPPLVLVADDQIPTTAMLERVFEYEGYQVKSVHDGIAALETAKELLPDLILLDINMPKMNGFDVLKELREYPKTSSIPTILITAIGEMSKIVEGLNLGADDYVRKPFYPQELLARAQSKMRARQLEEKLQRRTEDLEALLRVSEALNKNLEIGELSNLIVCLTLDLLPGEIAILCQLDDSNTPENQIIMTPQGEIENVDFNIQAILNHYAQHQTILEWKLAEDSPINEHYPFGLATPLKYGDGEIIDGVLMIGGTVQYDDHYAQILQGIASQANMALHNAELFGIKENYARDLELKVAERTKELRSTQHMLIRSEKLASIGRLSASIAHEINNPLMPIKIILDDMLEDIQEGYPVEAIAIEKTLESVERIRRVVARLLEFTGKGSIARDRNNDININDIIQNVNLLVQKSFEQERKQIKLNLNEIPNIIGDKDGLEQVVINMVLNASYAIDEGGTVTVNTYEENNTIVTEIIDDGCGIEQDMIDTIFEPFVTTKDNGNGLGLFVSYGIIQSHHGTIEVESEVSKGTKFTIYLPITPDE